MNNPSVVYSPFSLENSIFYEVWREQKLQDYPKSIGDLVVEINDPRDLNDVEFQQILTICQKSNMVIYVSKTGNDKSHDIPIKLGQKFGLRHMDHNMLSDQDGLTSLTVAEGGTKQSYIPYSNKPIQWHTDGYYNKPQQQIHAIILHCVQSAATGGENRLLDHEIAYLKLRDQNPDFIRALMQPDVMTIPARMENGEVARAEETGPVFSIDSLTGNLHMRYTIRKRNIVWKDDAITKQALAALTELLNNDSPYIFQGRLEPGMGLFCNNVLHDRTGFTDDDDHTRLLYRARFFDRIDQTDVSDITKLDDQKCG